MTGPILTRRLVLRQAQPADAGWIAAQIARPEVHRWLRGVPCPYGHDEAAEWVLQSRRLKARRIIECGGAPLGAVSLSGPLGYWLRPEAWGQGIATEAAAAMIERHFAEGGGAIGADYLVGNAASARVLDRLGFRALGRDVVHSEYWRAPVELVCLRLAPGDWPPGGPARPPVASLPDRPC
ncbi:GNAT family N-acetyltransferase [Mangrovicoccus algicola]|uniref:GNAT family N-acetyltransferase n=1 Tax=Mangrovicoccus algicola TaxID=2771008 RepID=A0A8J6YVV2_9RHOB|nr:GNAT family N-acetyltransferase [Mangrovicoccus algicola]MBE3637159.1 GNAT family N-acetyltransferase [Mangrovicoccus algicola]